MLIITEGAFLAILAQTQEIGRGGHSELDRLKNSALVCSVTKRLGLGEPTGAIKIFLPRSQPDPKYYEKYRSGHGFTI